MLSEKKLAEFIENEKKLVSEIEQLKIEREAKMLEHQNQLDQQSDLFKQKIAELEQRCKESENKRNSLLFDHEKEKAKWVFDREHMIAQKNDLSEQLEKIEKKKEQLLRENEKLKNEQRVQRRSINLAANTSNANLNNSNISNVNPNNGKKSVRSGPNQLAPNQDLKYSGMMPQSHQTDTQNTKNQNLTDITNFSGIMVYDPNKMGSNSSYLQKSEKQAYQPEKSSERSVKY